MCSPDDPDSAYDPSVIREAKWLDKVRCLGFNDGMNKFVKQAVSCGNIDVLIIAIQAIHLWLL